MKKTVWVAVEVTIEAPTPESMAEAVLTLQEYPPLIDKTQRTPVGVFTLRSDGEAVFLHRKPSTKGKSC